MPTDALTHTRDVMLETRALGFEKLRAQQVELGRKVRALLLSKGLPSVAAEGFQAPGVVVSYTRDDGLHTGKAFIGNGLQTAAGVPLQCDEPADYKTFRIGLFGLDKLQHVDRTVANLEVALTRILGDRACPNARPPEPGAGLGPSLHPTEEDAARCPHPRGAYHPGHCHPEGVAMNRMLALVLCSLAGLAQADSVTVTDGNASLKTTRDEPIFNIGSPGDPLRLLRTLEWTVDGRRILVYPSGPSTFFDVGHFHSGAHVTAQQIHAQGPYLGYAINDATGTVVGGLVYSLVGDIANSQRARLTEKLDLVNRTANTLTVSLAGLGFKPTQPALEVPDLSGLQLKGTTVVFTQGVDRCHVTDRSTLRPAHGPACGELYRLQSAVQSELRHPGGRHAHHGHRAERWDRPNV